MATVVNADIYKQIDRINKRLENILKQADKLESDYLVNKYQDVLNAAIPSDFLRTGKYGLSISKSKAAQQTLTQEQLDRLEALPTPGDFEAEILKNTAEEYGESVEDVTIEEMREYMDDVETVRNAEDNHGHIQYSEEYSQFMQEKGSKSYSELAEVVRNYERSLNQESNAKRQVTSNYDSEHANSLSKRKAGRSTSDRVR